MGNGLDVGVPVLVNRDRNFDVVVDHYRAFNLETGPNSGMDLMVDVPRQNARFDTFLELIKQLRFFADQETVLVVNHGMSDKADIPLGLLLPLTPGSRWNPEEYTLGLLAGFIGKNPSDSDYTAAETNSSMELDHKTIHMPKGTLKTLDTELRALRPSKLTRLELRACNLGGNPTVMNLLARVLGVTTIVAPRVHMFYSKIGPPGPLPDTEAGFTNWQRHHSRARTFTEAVASNPRRVGIQINGKHSHRTADFDTTNLDVKWFIEKFVCPGSGYVARAPGKGARINTLSFSGMDIGSSFALGQEDDYAGNLIEVAP
jgi:hypothetical protein